MTDKSIIHHIEKFYPGRVQHVLEVCKLIKSQGITPEKFMHCYFLADELASNQRIWGTEGGWSSSRDVILSIRKTICQQAGGDQLWNNFILDKAKRIVQSQEPPRGYAPHGGYYSFAKIMLDFFSEENTTIRESSLENSMPFLYKLINAKIMSSIELSDDVDNTECVEPNVDGPKDEDDNIPNLEDVTFSKPESHKKMKILQSTAVPKMICAMVAYVCNQRSNGMQIHNGMTFLACGASERLNEFFNFYGLSVSCQTVLRITDTLQQAAEEKIKEKMADTFVVQPFLCVDNIDFQQRVHDKKLESTSMIFHGTTGYLHFIPDSLTEKLSPDTSPFLHSSQQ
ncbi:hypothetical protein DFH28DRAFT_915784 [Melampsora americana]|nr:hypothetical protein DFH28DRAFT_915784 [Melampsora americana]